MSVEEFEKRRNAVGVSHGALHSEFHLMRLIDYIVGYLMPSLHRSRT